MALRPRVAVLLTLLACALPSAGAAESRVTVRIATQSPLSAEPAARGDEIRLGAQLALEQLGGPLERLGFRLELAVFDDQGRPDIAVANGAESIYVSATPTESAVGFYLRQGCRLAHPVHPDLFAAEPEDIHLVRSLR